MAMRLRRSLSPELDALQPGEYRKATGSNPIIRCPVCSNRGTLGPHHGVTMSGVVTPAYRCPSKGCAWFEWIHLDGWEV